VLTSIHHAYGAYIYTSPWRLHVVALAAAAATAIAASALVFRKREASSAGTIAFLILCAVTLAVPFGMIGFFEGGYNHVLKDLLYFAGAPREQMQRLFPGPAYEMPDSAFFELTGVAQLLPAVVGTGHLYRFVRDWWARRSGSDETVASPPQHARKPVCGSGNGQRYRAFDR
jgi:hypothetical protein